VVTPDARIKPIKKFDKHPKNKNQPKRRVFDVHEQKAVAVYRGVTVRRWGLR
jgi:hypothetical protein